MISSCAKRIVVDFTDMSHLEEAASIPEPNERSKIKLIIDRETCVEFEWGEYYVIGTAAYWISQARLLPSNLEFKLGSSLVEEVIRCLLGGYGISAEVGDAAFNMLKQMGLISLNPLPSQQELESALRRPLTIMDSGKVRSVYYRFPAQKSKRIYSALSEFNGNVPPEQPLALRKWLLNISGIGHKTASWIIRNYMKSNLVAIIDIHIQRAGLIAGFFNKSWTLPKDYELFEKAFLAYSIVGGVEASVLDSCIWEQMHDFGRSIKTFFPLLSVVG